MNRTPIITTSSALKEFAEFLLDQAVVAVDLEADSMHHYTEQVCLLQVTAAGQTRLIDPLALDSLEPLRPVLAERKIRKLFHAADYDLRCLRRDFGLEVAGLFDSMVAAQFCGEERIGLADLLARYFDIQLDKKYQRADWTTRPLPAEMVAYAACDTCYLENLAGLLEQKLKELGRLDWLAEECLLLEQVAFDANEGPMCLRIKGAGKLNGRQLAVLEELLQWRDRTARRRDVPPFKVVGNRPLLEIATMAPRSLRALDGMDGLPPRLLGRIGRDLLACVEKGLSWPESELPVWPRGPRRQRDPEVDTRLDALKQWRRKTAKRLGLDPGVMINNGLLEAMARLWPFREADLPRIEGLRNWQRREFGQEIMQVLAGCSA
ncbi:MAG: ribonuclease D [Alphaproteobacteria bacterium]|nr:MAG: ribonuclease D [Alphaproteobacteria bacterium]